MGEKYVFRFIKNNAEGSKERKDLLGGKGANLHEMCNLGLNVPPGFTISTEACTYFYENKKTFPPGMMDEVWSSMDWLSSVMGRKFGDKNNPLLVSVRSGARVSMPGMMDTVLNLGLNDETINGLIRMTNNPWFAYDSYRRFVSMFGDVVMGLKPQKKDEEDIFQKILENMKKKKGKKYDIDLDVEELKEIVFLFKEEIEKKKGMKFPSSPEEQLEMAIGAVFSSWMNPRAIEYRKIYHFPQNWGTACNVQAMVFGNMDEHSGSGVMFTRDPATGENRFYGEFLMNAQGEDVVAGVRTPKNVVELQRLQPENYEELLNIRKKLEKHYRDMQDIEFTIEKGKLYILQTRSGKRFGLAAIRIAMEMLEEGLIERQEDILKMIEPDALTHLLRPVFDPEELRLAEKEGRFLAKGLNAGPGAAFGRICFFSDEVEEKKKEYKNIILVRIETSPEDIKGMEKADGILTARGGMTSHAALVARQRGKVCVAGCDALSINYSERYVKVNEKKFTENDFFSIDGISGKVYEGIIKTIPSEVVEILLERGKKGESSKAYQHFEKLMKIAKEKKKLGVRANADTKEEAKIALSFGAEGIGLCRTEHMFFNDVCAGENRILSMRKMIISETKEERKAALDELLPLQRNDFIGIFRVMKGLPVTVRTLDPPLHEFLPHEEKDIQELSFKLGITPEKVKERIKSLKEANPMLGHRGCRLGITYPEITQMQAQAIFEAASQVKKEGIDVNPEIMIPLVGHVNELRHQEEIVRRVAKEVMEKEGVIFKYLVGTMIELPRAAVTAGEIAEVAEFFSFGTNDLTQTGFGISRDDYGKFIGKYLDLKILKEDPFITLDEGISKLVEIGVNSGRSKRKDLKVGICGEHGGDPRSIFMFNKIGLDYVSCSPWRVPVAIFSAALAAVGIKGENE